jgi:hypothetical protein
VWSHESGFVSIFGFHLDLMRPLGQIDGGEVARIS